MITAIITIIAVITGRVVISSVHGLCLSVGLLKETETSANLCFVRTESELLYLCPIKTLESFGGVQMADSSPLAQDCVVVSLKQHWHWFKRMLALTVPPPAFCYTLLRCLRFSCICFNATQPAYCYYYHSDQGTKLKYLVINWNEDKKKT